MSPSPSLVVDASVVLKWYIPEPDSSQALRVLSVPRQLLAPDLLLAEVGNILWKKVRRGEITHVQADRAAELLLDGPVDVIPTSGLLRSALAIADAHGRALYDALYLALAQREETTVVTADARLANALTGTPLAQHVRLLNTL